MPKFRKKLSTVSARQFLFEDRTTWPDELVVSAKGPFADNAALGTFVYALLHVGDQRFTVEDGDWIITDVEGNVRVLRDSAFRADYEPAE